MVVIIDYGMGNFGSIINMLKKIGYESKVTNSHDEIRNADKLILPGVGSFDNGMKNLEKYNLYEILNEIKKDEKKILGICLGMQLLTNSSEEGNLLGLGWIDAEVKKITFDVNTLKVPHMGWNIVKPQQNSQIFKNFDEEIRAYFVHSYYVSCKNKNDILATTPYGDEFVSVFKHNNIYGMQFHPEKSHKMGMKLLQNFLEL